MSATFNWVVNSMQCLPQKDGQTDVVFQVFWTCEGAESSGGKDYFASYSGSTSVPFSGGGSFTPYDQLTQAQVIGWVQDALGVDGVNGVQSSVQTQINNQINPPVVSLPLPWAAPTA